MEEGAVFARIYEEQDRAGAEGEARLLAHLAGRGVMTPRPIARADGLGFTAELERVGRAVALFPWRTGDMLCQAGVTSDVAREVGRQLASIHAAGADFPERRAGRFRVEDLYERLSRIEGADAVELRAVAPELREELKRANAARRPLPGGIVHGDLFRDNVLWSSGKVVALLDFESASDGSWAYDLMVTLLAWCCGKSLEPALCLALLGGYQEIRRLTEAERTALATEGKIAALRFTITRITDFAMRAGIGDRVVKDWRRFYARFDALRAMGDAGLRELLG